MKIKTGWIIPFLIFIFPNIVSAHAINYDVESLSSTGVAGYYVRLGFTHILPFGFDHILFILGIFFLNPNLRAVLWQATAFTIAHSITLALAATGVIHPLSSIIEPIIALSIAFIAIENIFITSLKWWRVLIVFGFGLVHGMGFAGALAEIGLPEKNLLTSIIGFNIGVELGQITIILLANYILIRWIKDKQWYRPRFLVPASLSIALFALWLTYERLGL
ncbi:MAG: HupE/UreJ family protein [Bacteroidetes bacterium]|nr:HupE/UreJ family protein [Bacteroidota bacterium]